MSITHEGYLLIADITGYTRYLSKSELEHAQETLTALLELLVENTRPPLVISRLAGDAVISYGLRENFFHGQAFIEKIEDTYVTFRKTLERLDLNNTCRCNACANISNLDLKFFVHYGTFGIQHISDQDELIGSDINLLHRLLKNNVIETTGFKAYALYTEETIHQLEIEDLRKMMTPYKVSYEHLGEVHTWVQDMHPVWEEKRNSTVVKFPEDRFWNQIEITLDLPLERAWDYLIQPEFRKYLIGSDRMEVTKRSSGRIATGSIYQCYHGDKLVPQTIMEWQPFEWMLVKELVPFFPNTGVISEYRLSSIEREIILTIKISKPVGPILGRVLVYLSSPILNRIMSQALKEFKYKIENDYQAHSAVLQKADISDKQIQEAAASSLQSSPISH
jgi:hypothetical protein